MIWCDKLACTPGAGFRLSPYVVSGAAWIDALTPMLSKLVKGETLDFNVDRNNPFDVAFTTNDGFQYGCEAAKVFVDFMYNMALKSTSAGPPVAQLLSTPAPYSKLLPELAQRLADVTLVAPNAKNRTILRVGIITTTNVSYEEAPPGIVRFIKYMARPWGKIGEGYQFQVTGVLHQDSSRLDQCIYTVTKSQQTEDLLVIKLDWQRYFTIGRAITQDSVSEILSTAQKAALQHFEDIGEGSRFDEEIIRQST